MPKNGFNMFDENVVAGPAGSEIALQKKLLGLLRGEPDTWKRIRITNCNSMDVSTLFGLIGEYRFARDFHIREEAALRPVNSKLSVDLFGLVKPDLVLSSTASGQDRIVIEVKQHARPTHREPDASQFLRYFLHLLVTSDSRPRGRPDIRRAMLMAAPASWFESESKSRTWRHLVTHYGALSKQFDITLGEIRAEDLWDAVGKTGVPD